MSGATLKVCPGCLYSEITMSDTCPNCAKGLALSDHMPSHILSRGKAIHTRALGRGLDTLLPPPASKTASEVESELAALSARRKEKKREKLEAIQRGVEYYKESISGETEEVFLSIVQYLLDELEEKK